MTSIYFNGLSDLTPFFDAHDNSIFKRYNWQGGGTQRGADLIAIVAMSGDPRGIDGRF
jgi:hypothetical protein